LLLAQVLSVRRALPQVQRVLKLQVLQVLPAQYLAAVA